MHDQIGFSACAAPDEKCDNLFCAPKLVSKLLNGNKVRIVVKRLEDGKSAKDHRRSAAVRLGGQPNRLSIYGRVSEVQDGATDRASDVLFGNVPRACVVEGDEELTLRGNDCGTQQLLVNTARIQANKWRPPFGQDDWAAICQALYQCGAWRDVHSTVLEVAKVSKRRQNELPVDKNWRRTGRATILFR